MRLELHFPLFTEAPIMPYFFDCLMHSF